MITAIISFFASNAGGALVGLIIEQLDHRRKDRKEKQEAERETRRLLAQEQGNHFKQLDKQAEGEKHEKYLKVSLWGLEWERRRPFSMYPPRTWVVAFCLGLLCTTLCFVVGLWASNPSETVITLNPNTEPSKIGILWGVLSFEWLREEVFVLNTGGVVYAILHGIMFILSTAIVGGVRRALR